MSEYTPTTDVVRSLYSGESTDGKESNKEFDRWLAAYKAKTIARTEERIIKLLEDNWVEPMDWLSVKALIEGEQK